MKDKIIIAVIFALTFVVVTGGIIFFNSKYENIFKFNLTPTAAVQKVTEEAKIDDTRPSNTSDSLQSILGGLIDSIKSGNHRQDTIRVQDARDTTLYDSIKILQQTIKELSDKKVDSLKLITQKKDLKKNKEKVVNIDSIKAVETAMANKIQVKDSTYKAWIKKTGSLYEAMDSRKAAKIIETYSDNIAKDILYAMKKKKAAEILSQLSPDTVNRITSTK